VMGDSHLIGFLVAHAGSAVDESWHGGNLTRADSCFCL